MIYELGNVYYLSNYEIANIEIKYNPVKMKNVLIVRGTGIYATLTDEQKSHLVAYTFKELEEKLLGNLIEPEIVEENNIENEEITE